MTIDQLVRQVLVKLDKQFGDQPQVESFRITNQRFEQLVSEGIVSKRGNNLLSTVEITTIPQPQFNVSEAV